MYQESSLISKMLRSEAKWFPHFMSLCEDKLLFLLSRQEENLLIPLLESILTCQSYRQVTTLLNRHHWATRQAIYILRTRARLIAYYPTYVSDGSQYCFHNP